MEDDFMNELENFMANQTPPPPVQTSKNVKDVLGERLRTQMGGEKRKLEDSSESNGILSKTQKMDNDLESVAAAAVGLHPENQEIPQQNGTQRLLAQALMDKPRNLGPGIKSPSPELLKKENELANLLNEHPQNQHRIKMQGPPGMMGGPQENFYPMQPQQRVMQQQRPPMGNNWNNNMCNPNVMPPQKMAMRPQGPRGYFPPQEGPPPNAWVQQDPNKVPMMVNQGPNYFNNRQRSMPMPPRGGNYQDYNGQMYNGNMPQRGHFYAENVPHPRFGSPNQGHYSPNNGNPDSMHALRMSANFGQDSNPGYNGYEFQQQNGYRGGPQRQMYGGPMMGPNRVGMPQSSPLCHNGNEMPPFQPQNQFMEFHNNNTTMSDFENFQGSNPGPQMENWRSTAFQVRQSLLNKLKEALLSAGTFQNAQNTAESYEREAFESAESLKDYQYKLVKWLASIYESNSSQDLLPTLDNEDPDSSTNGLNDLVGSTSSPKMDQNESEKASNPVEDLLATPTSSPNSPVTSNSSDISSSVITTASNSSTTTTTSGSPNNSPFQCPVPPVIEPEKGSKIAPNPNQNGAQNRRVSNQNQQMSSIGNNPQSVDSGIGLGSPRSITSASSSTLYSPKIQGTSPSLTSDNSPEKAQS